MKRKIAIIAILLLALYLVCAPAKAQTPTVQVSPDTVLFGSVVSVFGEDFTPNSSVTVTVENLTTITGITANISGEWTANFTVPYANPAVYSVEASDDNNISASTTLTVEPLRVQLTPTQLLELYSYIDLQIVAVNVKLATLETLLESTEILDMLTALNVSITALTADNSIHNMLTDLNETVTNLNASLDNSTSLIVESLESRIAVFQQNVSASNNVLNAKLQIMNDTLTGLQTTQGDSNWSMGIGALIGAGITAAITFFAKYGLNKLK
jgi:hypothetical protein